MKRALFVFVAASLIAIPTSYAAQEEAASTREVQAEIKIDFPAWLEGSGALSSSQIVELLGVNPTVEQRAQIEEAVIARNLAIRQANAQLSSRLRDVLKTDDAALSKRAKEQKEARELEIIRRRQPARYQSMKRKMEAQKK